MSGLSCYCEYEGDGDWWIGPDDFKLLDTKRSRKCCSCKAVIRPGDECAEFERFRRPGYGSIEEKILGEDTEVQIASFWMCEECAGLYMALTELGFCFALPQSMKRLVEEYRDLHQEQRQRDRIP